MKSNKGKLMKLLLSLLLLNTLLSALPASFEKKICQELGKNEESYGNRCENGSTITFYKHSLIDNDKVILFLYLDDHNPEDFFSNAPKIPLLLNNKGQWSISKIDYPYLGRITKIEEDFAHRLWVASRYGIESSVCDLTFSKDGKIWKNIHLPRRETIPNYDEVIEQLCFEKNHLVVTFNVTSGGSKEFWRVPYDSIESQHPQWKKLTTQSNNCINPTLPKNDWKIRKENKSIIFEHKRKRLKTVLLEETLLEKPFIEYYIQVGVFKNLSNVEVVENLLSKLESFYFTRADKFINRERHTKLLIGYGSSKKDALNKLIKLKKKYPKNRTIQSAFVTFVVKN